MTAQIVRTPLISGLWDRVVNHKPPIYQKAPWTGRPSVERWELVSFPRTMPSDTFVFHDTAGMKQHRLVENSLLKHFERGGTTGVTWSINYDGLTAQHHDHIKRFSRHCCAANARSNGVEVINPFDPRKLPKGDPNQETIVASWMGGRKVYSPTREQLEAGYLLIRWLVKTKQLVLAFPGVENGRFIWQTLPKARVPMLSPAFKAGIYAHGHLNANRADGYLQTYYVWCRVHGYTPSESYDKMKQASATVKGGPGRMRSSALPEPKRSMEPWVYVALGLAVASVAAYTIEV